MTDKSSSDPLETFRNLITEWERGFDSLANRVMGTDEYSRSMNGFQDLQLRMQKNFSETMAKQWKTINVPSRDDFLRQGETLRGLETRLERIEELLSQLTSGATTSTAASKKSKPKRPPRTKRPPSKAKNNHD